MKPEEKPEAGLYRQWARRLRQDAADLGAYQQGWLHTRRLTPQGIPLDRYCAYGYAVETASGRNAHDEMSDWAESEDFDELLVYADAGLSVTRPDIETLDCFGLIPASIPPEEFTASQPGVIEVKGRMYVELAAVSDAGQRFWSDIAGFLEAHADWLERQ